MFENPHICVMVMFGRAREGVEGTKQTRNSGYPFGVKLEGKSFNFLSYSHAYRLNFSTYFFVIKEEENNKRETPLASSKNRARLNNSG